MTIYISAKLGSNRKGRFLHSIVQAQPLTSDWQSNPPQQGLLLVQGDELNQVEDWRTLYHWSMQTGCAALVVDPLTSKTDCWQAPELEIDWHLAAAPNIIDANTDGLTKLLADEITQKIVGFSGSSNATLHQIADVVHTRYIRKHSNSGLFAMTTLPLWSLNLLDHSDILLDWLNWLITHSGDTTPSIVEVNKADFIPDKKDEVVLLLIYAIPGLTAKEICQHQTVKMLFDTSTLAIDQRWLDLYQYGFISENRLTEKGNTILINSDYWAYAELLCEQLRTGTQ